MLVSYIERARGQAVCDYKSIMFVLWFHRPRVLRSTVISLGVISSCLISLLLCFGSVCPVVLTLMWKLTTPFFSLLPQTWPNTTVLTPVPGSLTFSADKAQPGKVSYLWHNVGIWGFFLLISSEDIFLTIIAIDRNQMSKASEPSDGKNRENIQLFKVRSNTNFLLLFRKKPQVEMMRQVKLVGISTSSINPMPREAIWLNIVTQSLYVKVKGKNLLQALNKDLYP